MKETKLSNLVFDMGNVVIQFAPLEFIRREGIEDEETTELLMNTIFRSKEWPMMDWGQLDEAEMEEIVLPRLPEKLRAIGARLISHWHEPILPIEGMEELIRDKKKEGYHIYLLSNASHAQHIYWERVPGHELFEGTVISADEKHVKPEAIIYETLLSRFGLKAEESLFIDDVSANVEGARAVGMMGYLFDGDTKKLREFLDDQC